jgi:predicted regulator of Ras-like GTPase activity (Roadblock/LC7/MglB family)
LNRDFGYVGGKSFWQFEIFITSFVRFALMSALTKWFDRFPFNISKKFHRRQHDEKLTTLSDRVRGAREEAPSFPDFSSEDLKPVDGTLSPPEPLPTTPPEFSAPSNHQPPLASLPDLEFTPVPEILRQFINRSRADLVLLTDRNGVPIAHCKNAASPESPPVNLEMIAKLAAGQIAATREINHTIGEGSNFSFLFQEGNRQNLFIYAVNDDFNLVVLIDKTIVVGLAHIQANEVAASLQKALN